MLRHALALGNLVLCGCKFAFQLEYFIFQSGDFATDTALVSQSLFVGAQFVLQFVVVQCRVFNKVGKLGIKVFVGYNCNVLLWEVGASIKTVHRQSQKVFARVWDVQLSAGGCVRYNATFTFGCCAKKSFDAVGFALVGNFHTSAKFTSCIPRRVLGNVVCAVSVHKFVPVVKSVQHCANKCAQGAFAKAVCLLQDVYAVGKIEGNVF